MTHPETTEPTGQLEEWRVFCFEEEKVKRDVRAVFKTVKGISVSQNRDLTEGNTMPFTFWLQSSSQTMSSPSPYCRHSDITVLQECYAFSRQLVSVHPISFSHLLWEIAIHPSQIRTYVSCFCALSILCVPHFDAFYYIIP